MTKEIANVGLGWVRTQFTEIFEHNEEPPMERLKGASVLIGKTLTEIELAADKKAIRFTVDGEPVVAKCDGDCCSDTWIESVEMPAGGLPAKILEATDLNLPQASDELALYGLKLTTDKGDLVLDYRNESNGYYGGNLSWPGEYHYGGVYGQNNSKEEWQRVSHS